MKTVHIDDYEAHRKQWLHKKSNGGKKMNQEARKNLTLIVITVVVCLLAILGSLWYGFYKLSLHSAHSENELDMAKMNFCFETGKLCIVQCQNTAKYASNSGFYFETCKTNCISEYDECTKPIIGG